MEIASPFSIRRLRWTSQHWLLKKPIRAYGSGRYAIVDIAKYFNGCGRSRVWVPSFQCREVVDSLYEASGVEVKFFDVGEDLLPNGDLISQVNPLTDFVLLVDYFASLSSQGLSKVISQISVPVVLDCVHSWISPGPPIDFPENVTVILGFRKIFWRRWIGVVVIGGVVGGLPLLPAFSPRFAPSFPRNVSLAIRFGFWSKLFLRFSNLDGLEKVAGSFGRNLDSCGFIQRFVSPLAMVDAKAREQHSSNGEMWPFLSEKLVRDAALRAAWLRDRKRVVKRV